MRALILIASLTIAIAGCTQSYSFEIPDFRYQLGKPEPVARQAIVAWQYLDYSEVSHRQELKSFIGVDPVRTEWCAAFVNAVLDESGIISNTYHKYPYLARSYLEWGDEVNEPMLGDIIVFPRGNSSWQGHLGFYLGTITIDGEEYYKILGGNQDNKVSIDTFPASRALGIRRQRSI